MKHILETQVNRGLGGGIRKAMERLAEERLFLGQEKNNSVYDRLSDFTHRLPDEELVCFVKTNIGRWL